MILDDAKIIRIFNRIFLKLNSGIILTGIEKINNGANSRVKLLTCNNGKKYICKSYYSRPGEILNRLEREYNSFSFLIKKGIRYVPKPICQDIKNQIALYEFIEGKPIGKGKINRSDITQLCKFIVQLKSISKDFDSKKLPNAAEAYFSIDNIVKNIKSRYNLLDNVNDTVKVNIELKKFLRDDFNKLLNKIYNQYNRRSLINQVNLSKELNEKYRILSPSDFGFHNAIKKNNRDIVFIDFEYFGWDDPVKMTCDFILHPKMDITIDQKKYFLNKIREIFKDDPNFMQRLKLAYPLFGLKWCLIILNEFLPQDLERRQFAQEHKINREEICLKQLYKSKKMLSQVMTYDSGKIF
jgi:hypothetical protein